MKAKQIIMGVLMLGIATQSAFAQRKNLDSLANMHKTNWPSFAFRPGEKLEFKLHYGLINAGVATLETQKTGTYHNGREIIKVVGEGKSTGAFDWFYKVRDRYESYVYADKIEPYKFVRRVNEGGFIINRDYVFHQDKHLLDNGKHDTLVPVPTHIQDILSAFYYARTLDLSTIKKGDIISITTYLDFELYPVKVKFQGYEDKTIDLGTFRCMRFSPVVQKGRIFKAEEDLSIWITADQNKIPILAEAKVLVGAIKMELTDYRGIAGPIAKR